MGGMANADRIPSVDPEPADLRIRAARAESVLVFADGLVVPGPEAEMEAYVMANAGLSTQVVGWRRARPEEMQPGFRGAWSGDVGELEGLGRPWWWAYRQVVGVGSLGGAQVDMAAYERHHHAAQVAADEARAARGTI